MDELSGSMSVTIAPRSAMVMVPRPVPAPASRTCCRFRLPGHRCRAGRVSRPPSIVLLGYLTEAAGSFGSDVVFHSVEARRRLSVSRRASGPGCRVECGGFGK